MDIPASDISAAYKGRAKDKDGLAKLLLLAVPLGHVIGPLAGASRVKADSAVIIDDVPKATHIKIANLPIRLHLESAARGLCVGRSTLPDLAFRKTKLELLSRPLPSHPRLHVPSTCNLVKR